MELSRRLHGLRRWLPAPSRSSHRIPTFRNYTFDEFMTSLQGQLRRSTQSRRPTPSWGFHAGATTTFGGWRLATPALPQLTSRAPFRPAECIESLLTTPESNTLIFCP